MDKDKIIEYLKDKKTIFSSSCLSIIILILIIFFAMRFKPNKSVNVPISGSVFSTMRYDLKY